MEQVHGIRKSKTYEEFPILNASNSLRQTKATDLSNESDHSMETEQTEVTETKQIDNDVDMNTEELSTKFNQLDLSRSQTAKIVHKHLQEQWTLIDPDYGFKFKVAHGKLLVQVLRESFDEIVGIRDDNMYIDAFDKDEDMQIRGEEYHNPMYDSELAHPLGRFNQCFQLYKGQYIDLDDIKWCQSLIGQKRGSYASEFKLPQPTNMSESLATALDSASRQKRQKGKMAVLFILLSQNFDNFFGIPKGKEQVSLTRHFKIYMLGTDTVKVQKETMLANHLSPGEDLKLIYMFNY